MAQDHPSVFPGNLYLSDYMYFFAAELHMSIRSGKEGIVSAHTDIVAWVKFSSALPDDNRPCAYHFAAVQFDTSVLRITVSSVLGRALSFFMCHIRLP